MAADLLSVTNSQHSLCAIERNPSRCLCDNWNMIVACIEFRTLFDTVAQFRSYNVIKISVGSQRLTLRQTVTYKGLPFRVEQVVQD